MGIGISKNVGIGIGQINGRAFAGMSINAHARIVNAANHFWSGQGIRGTQKDKYGHSKG